MDDPNTSAPPTPQNVESFNWIWGVPAIAAEIMPARNGRTPAKIERTVRHLIDTGAFDGAIGKVGGMYVADRAKLGAVIRKRIETFEVTARAKRESKAKARAEREAAVQAMAHRQKRRKAG
jgi:hypothetical protein